MIDSAGQVKSAKLARAPLVHVLAQVKFATVLRMGEFVPAIQGEFNKLGLLRFAKSQVQSFTMLAGQPPRVDSTDRWDFLNRDRRTGVVLTSSFVVLQTSDYDTFSEYGKLLRGVLEVLKNKSEIALVERIGVRYVDLIHPPQGESYTQYLKPELCGFPFSNLHDPLFKRSFSTIQSIAESSDDRTLVIKCLPTNNGQFLPPDLMPSGLAYPVQLSLGEVAVILDFDHYANVDVTFEPEMLVNRIDQLHRMANGAFRNAVTEYAMSVWRGGA